MMKNAVTMVLQGGLGNQMFQYAAARALSLRLGVPLFLDDVHLRYERASRAYTLGAMAIKATKKMRIKLFKKIPPHIYDRLAGRNVPHFKEASFAYDPRITYLRSPVVLKGYFQSEKYFLPIKEQIAEEFSVTTTPNAAALALLEKIGGSDAICVHVRRGDYVGNPYHGLCSLSYYRLALDQVSQALPHPHCFIFSDDRAWVRENFRTSLPATVVDIHTADEAHEDLRLMAACHSFVIANSSLSWWGAWLGRHEKKQVVAPKQWFINDKEDTRDLLPENWLRL